MQKPDDSSCSRTVAMSEAHQAAAYNQWLASEIQASIDDPRPNIPHEEVMAELDASITAMAANAALAALTKKKLAKTQRA